MYILYYFILNMFYLLLSVGLFLGTIRFGDAIASFFTK